MAGSKYTLEMNASGNLRNELSHIGDGMNKVASQAEKLAAAAGAGGQQVGEIAGATKLSAFLQLQDKINGTKAAIEGFTNTVIGHSKAFVNSIITDAKMFEDAESTMRFAFGKNWKNMYDKVLAESAKLTFTFGETLELASSLGRLKINPFGTTGENVTIFKSKTGQMISALEVIQDAADAAGRGVDRMVFGLREALTDDWKSLRDTLDLSKKDIDGWKKELAKAGDQQAKYNRLIELMGERFGGAGALRAKNLSKQLAQIPDLLQQIRGAVGREGITLIASSIGEMISTLTKIARSKEVLAGLSTAFTLVAKAVSIAISMAAKFVGWIAEIVAAVPLLPVFAAGLLLVGVGLAFAASMGLGLAAALAGVIAGMTLIGIKVVLISALITAALLPVAILFGGAMLVGIAAVVAILAAGAQIVQSNWKGVGSFFERLKITFQALKELISSYNGETGKMSVATATALKKSGMSDFVGEIFNIWHKLNQFGAQIQGVFSQIGAALAPTLIPMFTEIKLLIFEVLGAFGVFDAKADANKSKTKDWADAGKELAAALIAILEGVIFVVRAGVMLLRLANDFGLIKVAAYAFLAVLAMIAAALTIIAVIGLIIGAALAAAFFMTLAPIYLIIKGVQKLLEALGLLKASSKDSGGLLGKLWGDPAKPNEMAKGVKAIKELVDEESQYGFGKDRDKKKEGAKKYDKAYGKYREGELGVMAEKGVSFDKLYQERPDLLPGTKAVAPPIAAPGAAGVGQIPSEMGGTKDIVAAQNKTSAGIGKLAAALSGQQINVNIDGKKVAEAIKGLQDGKDGGAL